MLGFMGDCIYIRKFACVTFLELQNQVFAQLKFWYLHQLLGTAKHLNINMLTDLLKVSYLSIMPYHFIRIRKSFCFSNLMLIVINTED